MLIFRYKKLFFLFTTLVLVSAAHAQQDHFVYLQTDNGRPFYVKMDKKILSSSAEGYIIIPEVTTGVYNLKVGFPKKEYPEESFSISVGDQNEGYLIKHFDDKGLQLFNLETLALIPGAKDSGSMAVAGTSKDTNPFTTMLANVVKDSTILQNHEVVVENPGTNPDTAVSAGSALIANNAPSPAGIADTKVASPAPQGATDTLSQGETSSAIPNLPSDSSSAETAGSPISKLASQQNQDGLQMVYADDSGNNKDTVSVFMPAQNESPDSVSEAAKKDNFDFSNNSDTGYQTPDTSQLTITPTVLKSQNEKKGFVLRKDTIAMSADSTVIAKTAPEQVFYIGPAQKKKNVDNSDKTADEKRGLFSGLSHSKPKTAPPATQEVAANKEKEPTNKIEVLPNEAAASGQNSGCKAFADNDDFLRLRKKMASEDSKEGMIKVAGKFFRSRCFSTGQIKDLSYLFFTDEGKYMFFDAAYAHTSDSGQYATLESQLKDPYYRKRFEALIGK